MRSSQFEELRMSDALDVGNTDLQKMKTEFEGRDGLNYRKTSKGCGCPT
jgi:hypothetical protein